MTEQPPTEQAPTEEAPTYEQARDELVTVVQRLEQGGTTLEESLSLWERGEHLATVCQRWLDGARERLETARQSGRPDVEREDLDSEPDAASMES